MPPAALQVTKLVSSIFDVPIALVSLVDKERQWFKSAIGLDGSCSNRESSFCAWTLLPQHPEVLVVPDACQDIRCAQRRASNSTACREGMQSSLAGHMLPCSLTRQPTLLGTSASTCWHVARRFQENELVTGEPHIRFYAGAPLVTSTGHRLGSL